MTDSAVSIRRGISSKLVACVLAFCLPLGAVAAPSLNPDHPETYTVQKGDTLWDISAMFLQEPWLWPEIWHVNPQIENPHLIYPGDVLRLSYVDGEPRITVDRRGEMADMDVVKLTPEMREIPLEQAIPTIPLDAIRPFLSRPSVVDKEAFESAPYVLSTTDGHLMAGAGDSVYVRGVANDSEGTGYRVVQLGEAYEDPETGEELGYEALHVGEGFIAETGDPATFRVTKSVREVLEGQRLLPDLEQQLSRDVKPRPPSRQVEGRIISLVDAVSQVGQYQIVVLNRGASDGLEPGNVLAVWQAGKEVRDRYSEGFLGEKVQLPSTRAGEVLVFRVAENISYALIMRSVRDIHITDIVRNP